MKRLTLLFSLVISSTAACEATSDTEEVASLEVFELLDIDSPCPFDSPEFSQCMDEADASGHESFRKIYPIDDVIDACAGAYDTDVQIGTCINNICSAYGCIYK